APANNALLHYNPAVTMTASASDSDGTIAKVEFFMDSVLLGSATSAPYSLVTDYFTPGTHKIWAKAIDNQNGTKTSAVSTVTVVNDTPTITITSPAAGSVFNGPDVSMS